MKIAPRQGMEEYVDETMYQQKEDQPSKKDKFKMTYINKYKTHNNHFDDNYNQDENTKDPFTNQSNSNLKVVST